MLTPDTNECVQFRNVIYCLICWRVQVPIFSPYSTQNVGCFGRTQSTRVLLAANGAAHQWPRPAQRHPGNFSLGALIRMEQHFPIFQSNPINRTAP